MTVWSAKLVIEKVCAAGNDGNGKNCSLSEVSSGEPDVKNEKYKLEIVFLFLEALTIFARHSTSVVVELTYLTMDLFNGVAIRVSCG